jgi:hypothetical protein
MLAQGAAMEGDVAHLIPPQILSEPTTQFRVRLEGLHSDPSTVPRAHPERVDTGVGSNVHEHLPLSNFVRQGFTLVRIETTRR